MRPVEKTPVTTSTDRARRVIKRYSNRKLYDTRDSRYVTLIQIAEMVRAGEDVQIIDNATKEDKTEVTLALIISEELKIQPRSVPLGTLRDLIQERSEKLLTQLREGPIGRLIPNAEKDEKPIEARDGVVPVPDKPKSDRPEKDKGVDVGKGLRFHDIVETSKQTIDQWQHTIDDRIRAVLPSFSGFRDLQTEVKKLAAKVEELEGRLRGRAGRDDSRKE